MCMGKNYKNLYGLFWNPVNTKTKELIMKHAIKGNSLLEIGFGSGHYLAAFSDEGFNMSGVEIKENTFRNVKEKFDVFYPEIKLIQGDLKNISGYFDLVYSTGLMQCLPKHRRKEFFMHIATLSPKVIYTVPKINIDRNIGSRKKIAVAGCEEYETSNIAYELSKIYKYVESGTWYKDEINMDNDFIWYYCNNPRNVSEI